MKQLADGKMFTFRLSSYHFIQYLLIVFVSSGVIAKQTPEKCAAYGEYCLNHWDCCSNACLSYMYRCARGHGIYPYPFLGVSYKPSVTLEQILDQNFASSNELPDYQYQAKPYFVSRFGGDADLAATEIKIVLQTTSETPIPKNAVSFKESSSVREIHLDSTTLKNSVVVENNLESTTLKNSIGNQVDLTTSKSCMKNHIDSTTLKTPLELEESLAATEHLLGEEKTKAQTGGGFETTQEPVQRSSDKPSCAEIGEKCYQHEDCCDRLCHGYLHQCVT